MLDTQLTDTQTLSIDIDEVINNIDNEDYKKILKGVKKKFSNELASCLGQGKINPNETLALLEKSVQVFLLLLNSTKVKNMLPNKSNNEMLATLSIEAAFCNEISLWRFVCFPNVSLNNLRWNYIMGDERYDTLTKALDFDRDLMQSFDSLGISPNLTFVIDDWETPYLRVRNQFYALNPKDKRNLLRSLLEVKGRFNQWISRQCNPKGVTGYRVLYFSDFLEEYSEFEELIDATKIEADEEFQGILRAEIDFCRRMDPNKSDMEIYSDAKSRIVQYAVEASLLKDVLPTNSLYLNSEFPVQTVWAKLNLIEKIPTLFYVTDDDVRNI